MPSLRSRRTRISLEITPEQIFHLNNGHAATGKNFPFRDEEHRRDMYFKYKSFLIESAGEFAPFIEAMADYDQEEYRRLWDADK